MLADGVLERVSEPWGEKEKRDWLAAQRMHRSYYDDVRRPLKALNDNAPGIFKIEQYGALSINPARYPVFAVKVGKWDKGKRTVVITGGVHGYERSGVKGSLLFLLKSAQRFSEHYNVVVMPCISPWGYETINRWNPDTDDVNRQFIENATAEEAILAMQYLESLGVPIFYHQDNHETTDTDASVFGPTLAAKLGLKYNPEDDIIPDGFYLVVSEDQINLGLEKAIIESVEKETHIALPDNHGKIIGVTPHQRGVVALPKKGFCMDFMNAANRSTTEIYPDSPQIAHLPLRQRNNICNRGQLAAINGALEHLLAA